MLKDRKAPTAEAFVSTLAANIRALREHKGWSLSELASAANIGKSTLSMLESGAASPNIETLWGIAAALGVAFSDLLEPRTPEVRVVRAGEGLRVESEQTSFHSTLLVSGGSGRGRFEIYTLTSEPGAIRRADAHTKGCIEHVYLIAGRMRVGPTGAPVELAPGDLASFAGDAPHVYETLKKGTRGMLVMEYS